MQRAEARFLSGLFQMDRCVISDSHPFKLNMVATQTYCISHQPRVKVVPLRLVSKTPILTVYKPDPLQPSPTTKVTKLRSSLSSVQPLIITIQSIQTTSLLLHTHPLCESDGFVLEYFTQTPHLQRFSKRLVQFWL